MTDDLLIQKLTDLCGRFSEKPIDGRYEVAKRAGLSEQYLYQILSGKPMQNGNKRNVGAIARKKLTKAFPDWLDAVSVSMPSNLSAVDAELILYFHRLPEAKQRKFRLKLKHAVELQELDTPESPPERKKA